MKAILVIDMPMTCRQCRFKEGALSSDELVWLCSLNDEHIELDETSEWCPLKPMPTELEWFSANGDFDEQKFVEGWNACLEEIEK